MVAALSPTLPRSLGYAFLTHRPVQSPVLQLSSVRRPNQGWRHYRTEEARRCPQAALAESSTEESTRGQALLEWLDSHGIPEQKVELNTIVREGRTLDVTVASQDMEPGDLALRIPEDLVITLRSVFEDGTVAEILTTGKLSELACLTLYLMYEKKMGRDSILVPVHQGARLHTGARPDGGKVTAAVESRGGGLSAEGQPPGG
eukprot:jgi/Botrbrau1/6342/Bobra.0098s0001.1